MEKIMFSVNEYFEGQVKSISFTTKEGPATIGVMAPGEYEFGTKNKEIMTIITGQVEVLLPGEEKWKIYGPQQTFSVPAQSSFKIRVKEDSSYLCFYK